MAFKMKGSAFKLGNVATKSALKQKPTSDDIEPTSEERYTAKELARLRSKESDEHGKKTTTKEGREGKEGRYIPPKRRSDEALMDMRRGAEIAGAAPMPMKSPMKQEYSWLNPDPDRENIPSEPMSPEEIKAMYPEQYMRDQRLEWMNDMRSVDRKDYPTGPEGDAEYEAALKNESINLDDNYNYQMREYWKEQEDIAKRQNK